MAKIRLNKYLATAGIWSRREADQMIAAGRVSVSGILVEALGSQIDPAVDQVLVDGRPVQQTKQLKYYAIYKPKGVISTAKDELNRQSVTNLAPKEPRVYPVGRLDADSEGLMILTNDGGLTQEMTHPSFEHEKEYEVETRISNVNILKNTEILKNKIIRQFKEGLVIDGVLMKADHVQISKIQGSSLRIQMVLHTGYNRQIRKMCSKVGLQVIKLTRTRIGKLSLDKLKLTPGQYKTINRSDII